MRIVPAYTLTEILVVLAILGGLAALSVIGTPGALDRAAFEQARDRLVRDLDMGASEARRRGAYGVFRIPEDSKSYTVLVADRTLVQRNLPAGFELASAGDINLDPSGRYATARFVLQGPRDAQQFEIDPFSGRATRSGDGANGGPRGQRHRRNHRGHVPGRASRRARRSGNGAEPNTSCRRRQSSFFPGANRLAELSRERGHRRLRLDDALPHRPPVSQSEARSCRVPIGPPLAWAATIHSFRNRLGRERTLPALTLMELLVALAIAALMSALIAASLGTWLRQGRQSQTEAHLWRDAAVTQTLLSEVAAGAINPRENLSVSSAVVRVRSLLPRVAARPLDIDLTIEKIGPAYRLTLGAASMHSSTTLLTSRTPLRFAQRASSILVEAQSGPDWDLIAVATMPATAPLTCAFDLITRDCR